MKLLSIIIPVYNQSSYIAILLDSIFNSIVYDSGAIEVIVIDDASTDDSLKILDEYNNIVLLKHDVNQGVAETRNSGIKAANGKWIVFIDGDDYLLNDGLKKILDIVKGNYIFDLVYMPYITSDTYCKTGMVSEGIFNINNVFNVEFFRKQKVCLPIVKRDVLIKNNIFFYAQNLDSLFYRKVLLYANKQELKFIDDPVAVYRVGNDSSLTYMRKKYSYRLKMADLKIDKEFLFLKDFEAFLTNNKHIASSIIKNFLSDCLYSSAKKQKLINFLYFIHKFKCWMLIPRVFYYMCIPDFALKIYFKYKNEKNFKY